MSALPNVSVIIPTYNCARYLEEAVLSAVRQEGVNPEVLVIDDGSSDDTADVLCRLGQLPGVRTFSQANQGVSAARNLGLAHATADIICFLDADDRLMPGSLRRRAMALTADPERYGMVFGDWLAAPGGGDVHSYFEAANIVPRLLTAIDCRHGELAFLRRDEAVTALTSNWALIFTGTVALTREVIDTTGQFQVGRVTGEDTNYWYRALHHTQAVCVLVPLAQYNICRSPTAKYEAWLQGQLARARACMDAEGGSLRAWMRNRREIANCYADLVYRKYGVRRMFAEARAECLSGIKAWPLSPLPWKYLLMSFVPRRAALITQRLRCAAHRRRARRLLETIRSCDRHEPILNAVDVLETDAVA